MKTEVFPATNKMRLKFAMPVIEIVAIHYVKNGLIEDSEEQCAQTGQPEFEPWVIRFAESTKRRFFSLKEDWVVHFCEVKFMKEVENQYVIIPKKDEDGELIIFDGASVPFPWTISFLSLGILRPLGVMLTASIVHDFAYKYGYLYVLDEHKNKKKVEIERHKADELFREFLYVITRFPVISWLAWLAVRLGWLIGVKFAGVRFSGKMPFRVILITTIILTTIAWSFMTFPKQAFFILGCLLVVIYASLYTMSILVNQYRQ